MRPFCRAALLVCGRFSPRPFWSYTVRTAPMLRRHMEPVGGLRSGLHISVAGDVADVDVDVDVDVADDTSARVIASFTLSV